MREPIHSLPLPTRGACFVMFFRTIKIHHHQGAWVGQACFKGLTQTNERESCGTSEQSFLQEPISTKCIESRAPISFSALLVFVRQHHANILEEARWCKGTFFEHQPCVHDGMNLQLPCPERERGRGSRSQNRVFIMNVR
jgi:hypothetical protein